MSVDQVAGNRLLMNLRITASLLKLLTSKGIACYIIAQLGTKFSMQISYRLFGEQTAVRKSNGWFPAIQILRLIAHLIALNCTAWQYNL